MDKKDEKTFASIRAQHSASFQYDPTTEHVLGEKESTTPEKMQEQSPGEQREEQEEKHFLRTDIDTSAPSENFISVGEEENQDQDIEGEIPEIQGDPRCPWRPNLYTPESLEEDISLFVNWMKARPEEKHARKSFVKQVFDIIYKICGSTCEPTVFGSYVTDLYLPTSDIDVVILNSERQNPIHRLAKELRKQSFIKNIIVISKARVPLIKFEHSQTNIQMDISFALDNGPKNTAIVKQLLGEFALAKPLMILIKYILKQKQLNEVYTGGIGSYALFLMIISFLQQTDVSSENAKLSNLLIDFCELYGCEFNYYSVGISVGSAAYFSKERKGWVNDNQACLLSIEDPQDDSNDVSKSSYNIMAVRNILNSTFRILSSARASPALLDTIFNIDTELLQYRMGVQRLFASKVGSRAPIIPELGNIRRYNVPSRSSDIPKQKQNKTNISKENGYKKHKKSKKTNSRRSTSNSPVVNTNWESQNNNKKAKESNGNKREQRPWRNSRGSDNRKKARYS